MAIEENIRSYWQYWCYFQRVIKNKATGSENLIETGNYIPLTFGMMKIGEKIAELSSTHNFVERYVSSFRPNFSKMSNQDFPNEAKISLRFLSSELNSGKSNIRITIKPLANPYGKTWSTLSRINFSAINDNYIPFDIDSDDYESIKGTYEKSADIDIENNSVEIENLENLFWKFLQSQTIGFTLIAENGICELYGPSYTSYFLRPYFEIKQIVTARVEVNVNLQTEVSAESKVKGVCRDRNGNIITGVQCRIIVMDPDSYEIIGTGLSTSTTGQFLITISYKINQPVVVAFLDDTNDISGAELMTTVSVNTT